MWGNKKFQKLRVLSALAFKLGHLKHGGIPNLYRWQLMVHDWNHGKIPFYVCPPEITEDENTSVKFVQVIFKGI